MDFPHLGLRVRAGSGRKLGTSAAPAPATAARARSIPTTWPAEGRHVRRSPPHLSSQRFYTSGTGRRTRRRCQRLTASTAGRWTLLTPVKPRPFLLHPPTQARPAAAQHTEYTGSTHSTVSSLWDTVRKHSVQRLIQTSISVGIWEDDVAAAATRKGLAALPGETYHPRTCCFQGGLNRLISSGFQF